MMSSFAKRFDFLSPSPKLHVNKRESYHTIFGSFLSLIIVALTLAGSIYFGKELFYRKEPIALVSTMAYDSFSAYLDKSDYDIYLNVQDSDYLMFNDPQIFTFSAYNDVLKTNSDGTQTLDRFPLSIANCKNYYDSPKFLGNETILDLNVYFCIKSGQATIEGFWGTPVFSIIKIIIEKCVNSTDNGNWCRSEEEIHSKLNGGTFAMFSRNHILDMKSYNKPAMPYLDDLYYAINIDFTFDVTIGLKPLNFISDSGFILKDETEISTFFTDAPLLFYYGKRGNLLAQVIIEGRSLGTKIYRSYTKFQDILTKVGGLIKALTVIGHIIINYTAQVEFINDYIHNLRLRQQVYPKPYKSSLTAAPVGFFCLPEQTPNQSKLKESFDRALPQAFQLRNNSIFIIDSKKLTQQDNTQIIIHNYIGLDKSNLSYNSLAAFKDFFSQMICFSSKENKSSHASIKSMIRKMISIETLLERLWIMEHLLLKSTTIDDRTAANDEFHLALRKVE